MCVEGVEVVILIVGVIVTVAGVIGGAVLHAAAAVVVGVSVGAAGLQQGRRVDEHSRDGENNLLHLRKDALSVVLCHLVPGRNTVKKRV